MKHVFLRPTVEVLSFVLLSFALPSVGLTAGYNCTVAMRGTAGQMDSDRNVRVDFQCHKVSDAHSCETLYNGQILTPFERGFGLRYEETNVSFYVLDIADQKKITLSLEAVDSSNKFIGRTMTMIDAKQKTFNLSLATSPAQSSVVDDQAVYTLTCKK